jgi:hypothetical protein
MAPRVRLYPFEVKFIDLQDYLVTPKGKKIPVMTDVIRATNATEAKNIIRHKSCRDVVFLSAIRHPNNAGKADTRIRMTVLSPRQVKLVEAAVPVAIPVPTGYTFTAPAQTAAATVTIPTLVTFSTPSSPNPDSIAREYLNKVGEDAAKALSNPEPLSWRCVSPPLSPVEYNGQLFCECDPADAPAAPPPTTVPFPFLTSPRSFFRVAVPLTIAIIGLGFLLVKAWR